MTENKFETSKFYNDLSATWDKTRPKYTEEIFRKITSYIDKNKTHSILDFGCGTGLFCKYIADNFQNIKIDGIDISSQMVEKARMNCPDSTFYVGDISLINLPKYDIIISKDVFNHIENIPKTISKLNDLLNYNGMLIITNRERNSDLEKIVNILNAMNYKTVIEYLSFKPTSEEIELFLQTLSNFKEEHKNIIKLKLENTDRYYLVLADKK